MNCSFSGLPVPTDKLFVLYYPPAMSYQTWDQSYFAAARAREALHSLTDALENFFGRYVLTRDLVPAVAAVLAGLITACLWVYLVTSGWGAMGFASRYLLPLLALALLFFGRVRLRRFFWRWRAWREEGSKAVDDELTAIREVMADLPEDPDAEDAAAIMRRKCPSVLSDLAFFGQNFNAFTYMDFVLSPRLIHPGEPKDLPQSHSLHRDAYYVGDVVYDSWRMFQKDRRRTVDPRFIGSGGRRGVI